MHVQLVTRGSDVVIAGMPATPLLATPDEVVELIAVCFEHHACGVLLYIDNLPPQFFDLSSGVAGAVLQKLRMYQLKVAVVDVPGGSLLSTRFRELLADEQHGDDFRMVADRAAAEAWLLPS